MTQDFTLHCHTTFSDGKNTLEEMVVAAKKKGFGKIGISDHLIFHKNIRQSPSWEAMSKYPNAYIYRADFKQDFSNFKDIVMKSENFQKN